LLPCSALLPPLLPLSPPPSPAALLSDFGRQEAALNTLVKWLVRDAARLKGHLAHTLMMADKMSREHGLPAGLLEPFPNVLLVGGGGWVCCTWVGRGRGWGVEVVIEGMSMLGSWCMRLSEWCTRVSRKFLLRDRELWRRV
jgi:hypothetical protein